MNERERLDALRDALATRDDIVNAAANVIETGDRAYVEHAMGVLGKCARLQEVDADLVGWCWFRWDMVAAMKIAPVLQSLGINQAPAFDPHAAFYRTHVPFGHFMAMLKPIQVLWQEMMWNADPDRLYRDMGLRTRMAAWGELTISFKCMIGDVVTIDVDAVLRTPPACGGAPEELARANWSDFVGVERDEEGDFFFVFRGGYPDGIGGYEKRIPVPHGMVCHIEQEGVENLGVRR